MKNYRKEYEKMFENKRIFYPYNFEQICPIDDFSDMLSVIIENEFFMAY